MLRLGVCWRWKMEKAPQSVPCPWPVTAEGPGRFSPRALYRKLAVSRSRSTSAGRGRFPLVDSLQALVFMEIAASTPPCSFFHAGSNRKTSRGGHVAGSCISAVEQRLENKPQHCSELLLLASRTLAGRILQNSSCRNSQSTGRRGIYVGRDVKISW